MRYREQTSVDTHSATHCTLVRLADSAEIMPRAFRSFRTLQQAVSFIAKCNEERQAKLRKSQYGDDPRDTRYTVNYFGSAAKARVRLAPKRVIMTSGITLDRLLPVVMQS